MLYFFIYVRIKEREGGLEQERASEQASKQERKGEKNSKELL
jgi:hypothetical protein